MTMEKMNMSKNEAGKKVPFNDGYKPVDNGYRPRNDGYQPPQNQSKPQGTPPKKP